jgi:hypothetical protein
MPRRTWFAAALALASLGCAFGGVDQPNGNEVTGNPPGWVGTEGGITSNRGVTSSVRHGGSYAFFAQGGETGASINVTQRLKADAYRGKRVRFSGWLRATGITIGPTSALWMRVDNAASSESFDNMYDRPMRGTTGWTHVEIVLDVPEQAVGIIFGVFFNANGTLLVDDLAFEVVSKDVPVTYQLSYALSWTPEYIADLYKNATTAPVNLDFEAR